MSGCKMHKSIWLLVILDNLERLLKMHCLKQEQMYDPADELKPYETSLIILLHKFTFQHV